MEKQGSSLLLAFSVELRRLVYSVSQECACKGDSMRLCTVQRHLKEGNKEKNIYKTTTGLQRIAHIKLVLSTIFYM